MPGGDRTGPEGAGPRTGRAMGYCSGNDRPGFFYGAGYGGRYGRGRGYGRGFGRGMGWGRGARYGRWYNEPAEPYPHRAASIESEKTFVEREIDLLTGDIEALKKRLEELDKE